MNSFQSLLPEDKMKVMNGCYNPATVLGLVDLGVDVFDSSYAYQMTEQKKALVFLCDDCNSEPTNVLNIADKRY